MKVSGKYGFMVSDLTGAAVDLQRLEAVANWSLAFWMEVVVMMALGFGVV